MLNGRMRITLTYALVLMSLFLLWGVREIPWNHGLIAEPSATQSIANEVESYSRPARPNVKTMVQKGHSAIVEAVYFTPNENRMLSLDGEGGACLWETANGRLITTWIVQPQYLRVLGFDQRGNIVGLREGYRYRLDPLTGKTVDRFPAVYARRQNVKHFTGSMFAATWVQGAKGSPTIITVWDMAEGKPLSTIPFAESTEFNITIDPNGSLICITWRETNAWKVSIYHTRNGRMIRHGTVAQNDNDEMLDFTQAALHPEGHVLAVPENETNLRILDCQIFDWCRTLEGKPFMPRFKVQFDRTGRYCTFKNGIYGYTEVIDFEKGTRVLAITAEKNAWISPSGRYLVNTPANPGGMWVRYTGYTLTLMDLINRRTRDLDQEGHWVLDMALSADGRILAVVEETLVNNDPARIVKCLDLWEARETWRLSGIPAELEAEDYKEIGDYQEFQYQHCILSDDGRRLMVQTTNGAVYVFDLPSGRMVYHQRGHLYVGHGMSPDGQYLAVTSLPVADGDDFSFKRVTLVDIDSKKAVQAFRIQSAGEIHHVAFSPDSTYLACVADNRVDVRLNEIAIAEMKAELDHLEFRSHIVVWDLRSGRQLVRIVDQESDIWPLGFSQDSQYVVSGRHIYRRSGGKKLHTVESLKELAEDERGPFRIHSSSLGMNPHSRHYVEFTLPSGAFKIKSSSSHGLLATLYDFKNGPLIVAPEGFYNGSGAYSKNIHFVREGEVLTHDKFYENRRRPDFVRARFKKTAADW